jgi:phosphonate transport system substrate-binding protein
MRIGLTPVLLDNDTDLLEALASYLHRRTGIRVDLQRRRTYQEISALLLSNQLEAAWICGYPYVQAQGRLSLVAVPVWNGRPQYQSYVIAAADGPQALADLRGGIHAFSDPDSNSGWLVTAHRLALMGETPSTFFSRFFFTYGHRNVIRAVGAGLANSGSVDGYVFDLLNRREPGLTAGLAVIERSAWHGFPPIACPTEAASSDVVLALTEALIGMAGREDGARVLSMLGLDGFQRASPDLFASIAAMVPATRAVP